MTSRAAGAPSYHELSARLAEAEAALEAVVAGTVDALTRGHGAEMIALEGADSFFRTLVTEMQEATASLDSNGTVLYANPRFGELLGMALSQVLGRTLVELTAKAGRTATRRLLAEAARGPARGTLELLHGDGRLVPVAVSAAPLAGERPEVCLVATDLTERKQAEITLREAEERFRSAFDQAPIGMALLSLAGRFVRVNAALAAITGRPEAQLLGAPLSSLLDRADATALLSRLTRLRAGEQDSSAVEVRYLDAAGSGVWVAESAAVIRDGDGRAHQILLQVQDIGDRHRLLAELNETNADLQAANGAMQDFVAVASHDLRSPVMVIAGFATLLTENWATYSEDDRRTYVANIDRKSRHLSLLVDDLLTLSGIEGGELNMRPEPIVLRAAIDECLEASGGDTASVSVSCSLDLVVRVVPHHLGRILNNYVQNAFKYGAPPVRIDATRVGGAVEVRVLDHGPGVPPEFVPRLFGKFARADTPSTRAAKGTGLGLSIVRGLAEANGGQTRYEPNAPNGACFVVRLPAADGPGG